MPTNKKRILVCSEAHYLSSGFSKIYKELLHGLYNSGKYEIAEFATYGLIKDNRNKNSPWKFYANHVDEKDPRHERMASNPINQFGRWRFERVLLDFKPDICIEFRDSYMYNYQAQSPLRPFFHHIIMPTCDSHPQKHEWISDLIKADSVFTYTKYAYNVIKNEGGGKVKLIDVSTPCVDADIFKPAVNPAQNKKELGLQEDAIFVGLVARNQKRKLIPDLMKSFRIFLDRAQKERPELAKKVFLYLHTSYPDHGWELPYFIQEHGLSTKCLFTYSCHNCKHVFGSFFQDVKTICPKCKKYSAMFPNVSSGVEEEHLAKIFQTFDFYVQMSNCGGLEMPIMEASACGVPTSCTNYSGMEDFVEFLGAKPIPIARTFFDMENTAYRVYPDIQVSADLMYETLSLPEPIRRRKGFDIRKKVLANYTWDKFVAKYEKRIDEIELTGLQGKWDGESRVFEPNMQVPEGIGNAEFVDWCYENIYGEPQLTNTYETLYWLRLLNHGMKRQGQKDIIPIDRQSLINFSVNQLKNKNYWEQIRTGQASLPKEDYIEYAKLWDEE